MNVPTAIEEAFADLIKGYKLGSKTIVRCWHSVRNDVKWRPDVDLSFPCVDVRCAPPKPDEIERTLLIPCRLQVFTKSVDDKNHQSINRIEEAVQSACDALYSQFIAQAGVKYAAFVTAVEAACSGLDIGGFTFGEGLEPYDNDGLNTVGITMTVHYSRSDF